MKVDPSQAAAELLTPATAKERPPQKKRWTWRRVLGAAGGGLAGIVFVGYFAVNLVLQSSGARVWLLGELQDQVGMEFYYDEVRWSPIDGILVHGLRIDQSADAAEVAPGVPPFFHASKVRVDLFWSELINGQRRVKAIEVIDPEVYMVRSAAGKLLLPPSVPVPPVDSRKGGVLKPAPSGPKVAKDTGKSGTAPAAPVEPSGQKSSSADGEKAPAPEPVLVLSPELTVENGKFTIYDAGSRTAAIDLRGVGVQLPPVVDAQSPTNGEIRVEDGHVALVPGMAKESAFWPMQWPVRWEGSAILGERKEFNVRGGRFFGEFLWNPRVEGVPLIVVGDLKQFNLVDAVDGPTGDFQLASCWLSGQVRFEALLSRSNSAVLTGALGAENVVIQGGPALSRFASGVGLQLDGDVDGEDEMVRMTLPVGVTRFRWSPTSMQDQKVDFQAASNGMSVSGAAVVSRSGRVVSRASCVLSGPAMQQLEKLEERLPRALHFGFRPVELPTLPTEADKPASLTDGAELVPPAPAEVVAVGREFLISGTLKEPLVAVWDRGELLTFGSLVRRISANIMPPPDPEPESIDDELLPMD
ncbi:hypothetical protein [Sulfuriroseicoccus oceanibius]|uniref:AsmA-like C-terminal domain-containing protein n=1 Tax=Sulfuriroseicoccus oceanibius TaxID=2707525 RepID=A0A6B3LAW8_9BACT|nr:hypothetical protein [Sulfuriroseicoccus oceanibius]QQL46165.1 hypothetical protein G3M56_006180 [Sulfuriroseicoccus oceanibius]